MRNFRINPLPSHQQQPHRVGHRNCSIAPDGSLRVRPAYRSLASVTSGSAFVFGFSHRSPNTGEMFHYVGERSSTTQILTILVLDDQLATRHSFEVGKVPGARVVATSAVIVSPTTANLEILITSPQFNSVYGLLGGALASAQAVASVNPGTTALDMPNGLSVGVNGRAIIATGRVFLVSDARAPRTFTGINASGFDGTIYGLHTLPGGNLAIVTDAGTYYLPADAFFQGQQVAGVFDQLSAYAATGYQQTAVADGRLMGLSRNGLRELSAGLTEIDISDPHQPLALVEPISQQDFRSCRLFPTERGPLVVPPGATRSLCETDLERGFFSWQEVAEGYSLDVVGTLSEREGNSLLVTGSEILRAFGNTEWTGSDVWGTVMGRLTTEPGESLVARYVTTASDTTGSQRVSVRGATAKSEAQPQAGVITGTSTWGSSTTLVTPPLRSRRTDWAERSDSITVESQHQHPGTRIGKIEIVTKGVGTRRPTA